MNNEETQTDEEAVESESADESIDARAFEALDEVTQTLMERDGTKLSTEEEVEEESASPEDEQVEEAEVDESTEAPEAIFTLDDGTAVTDPEEAKKGYLRHSDYTKKTQGLAEDRKKIERYEKLFNAMENDAKLTKLVVDYMTQGSTPAQAATPQAQELQVPEQYKEDPFVNTTVQTLNAMKQELAELKGDFSTTKQTTTQEREFAQQKATLDAKLGEGYEYLKGQVGKPPTPEEYVNRLQEYITEQGLDPQKVAGYILGGDPDYLRAKVDGAFKADIATHRKDTVNSGEKERKKRVAKTKTLQTAGKSKTAVAKPLPKGKDGKTDLRKSMVQIMDAQEGLPAG